MAEALPGILTILSQLPGSKFSYHMGILSRRSCLESKILLEVQKLIFALAAAKMTDKEKKQFMGSFISMVEIFDDEQPNGQILKHIQFAFPVFYNGEEVQGLCWDSDTTVETVCLLTHNV